MCEKAPPLGRKRPSRDNKQADESPWGVRFIDCCTLSLEEVKAIYLVFSL